MRTSATADQTEDVGQHTESARRMRREYKKDKANCKVTDGSGSDVAVIVMDFSQNLTIPSVTSTPSLWYFCSLLAVNVFGIYYENGGTQTNYLYDETTSAKGSDQINSMLHHFINTVVVPSGKKKLVLYADNCSDQNKNNNVVRFLLAQAQMGTLDHVDYKFFVKGHTKNSCDRDFGHIRKHISRSDCWMMDHIVSAVKDSVASNTTVHISRSNDFFKSYKPLVAELYKKLIGIQQYHFFQPGAVQCRKGLDDAPVLQDLRRKIDGKLTESDKASRMLTHFLEDLPPPSVNAEMKRVVTDMETSNATATTKATATSATPGGMETYRFDPLAALQTAIDHARRVSSANGSTDQQNDKPREIGSPNSNARFYRLEPSSSTGTVHNGDTSTATSLSSPPELHPTFVLQNSLMGGGIQRLPSSKPSVDESCSIEASTSSPNGDNGTKDAIAALGPPPDTPPSFLLSNSLTGGGISMLNLPKSHPGLDRLGSLTRLISQANETAKDLNTTLSSPPKTNPSLDRLVSLTSVTSENGETAENTTSKVSHSSTSHQEASSASPTTTHETESNSSNVLDLGPPPSGPPAFTIGNSLMGGGIELQPPAANVNTHNFDWKLHKSASSSGAEGNSSSATRGLSHGLRARLEQNMTSAEKGTDKS
ncbi:hypothetical protein PHMEG_0004122 [Phytophthora megakarya]|uniref:DUF7869 domain-containing protein n=1 Tax=Phytophthora megakarya TaxID=4795 RepID=A0A225WW71_9STRA|nr:hypothetical protein PHMEG_0004122 [Phytophthora megakarya]